MEELLVCVEVPSIQERFDIFAPDDMEIGMLADLLANGVQDLSGGRYGKSGKEMLMRRDPDMLLNPEKTLNDYDIRNGARLMLL